MEKKKVHQKLEIDVVEGLHQYRIKKLGYKATLSDAIRKLLKEVA